MYLVFFLVDACMLFVDVKMDVKLLWIFQYLIIYA